LGEGIIVIEELAPSLRSGGGANRNQSGLFLDEVSIIRRQRKKKKRHMPVIQEERRFPFVAGGGIG
jgi:hypothetical protein